MLSLIRKLFGKAPAQVQRAPASPVAPAPSAPAALELEGFARFASALELELPRPQVLSAEEVAHLDEIVRAIDERLASNPPSCEAFPSACTQILQMVANPAVGMADLARVVGQDQAMSAAVLRVANSAFYKSAGQSQTLREAIARLGASEVARLAGAVSVQALFSTKSKSMSRPLAEQLEELHRHAINTALGAAWLALRKKGARSDRAYLGGLLHDVGKAVVLRAAGELALENSPRVRFADPFFLRAVEILHGRVGGEMAERWSLPAMVQQLCQHHHDGAIAAGPDALELHIVRLVSSLRELRRDPVLFRGAADAIAESAAFLHVDPGELRLLDAEIARLGETASSLLAA